MEIFTLFQQKLPIYRLARRFLCVTILVLICHRSKKSLSHASCSVFAIYQHLLSVTIPETVTDIGYGAFSSCKQLKKAIVPKALEGMIEERRVTFAPPAYYANPMILFDGNAGSSGSPENDNQ